MNSKFLKNLTQEKSISNFSLLLLFVIFLTGCETEGYQTFEAWDADGDELVIEDEFGTTYIDAGYYTAWDLDADGIIDETEWDTGISTYYPVYDYDAYGAFDDWDIDAGGGLDEDEFVTGTYELWDTDNDGSIEVVEYEEWYHDL